MGSSRTNQPALTEEGPRRYSGLRGQDDLAAQTNKTFYTTKSSKCPQLVKAWRSENIYLFIYFTSFGF